MPSNVLASPSFVTGPNDNLATVDVFSGTAAGIVNSIASLAASYDVDLIGMLRAGAAAAQLLPLIEGVANAQVLLNPTAAIARLLTASNTLVNAVSGTTINTSFNTLSTGVQTAIGASGQVLGEVAVTVGDAVSTISNGGISDIQSLGALINSFSNSSAFMMVDTQALAGMAAGVINQCASYGISGVFQQMVSNITNPQVLNSIIQQTLPNLVQVSDITSLQAIANSANGVGISAINPSLLSSFTTNYSRSASGNTQQATPNQDTATWAQINTCYNAASPGWASASRAGDTNGATTLNLTALQGGSDDFNSALAAGVFGSSDPSTQLYGLAAVYSPVDVNTQLKSFYPSTYIDPALRATEVPTQPTQLNSTAATGVNASISATAVVNNSNVSMSPVPLANDQVGNQPNPATYQSVKTTQYQGSTSGSGQSVTNTAITWGSRVGDWWDNKNYIAVIPAA
jgi:hypothetical protein